MWGILPAPARRSSSARLPLARARSGWAVGVMLTHYSALKVAENFRVLQALYPGRIDSGHRSRPGKRLTHRCCSGLSGTARDVRHFPQQVVDVLAYLNDSWSAPIHSQASMPPGQPAGTPDVWLLGSYVESAHMAAKMGLPFSYAHFFGNGAENGPLIVESYRRHFQPSASLAEPWSTSACMSCAETEEEALRWHRAAI